MQATTPKTPGWLVLAGLVATLVLVAPASAEDDDWSVRWKNGLKFDSPDKQFQLKLGGRVQADFTFAHSDAFAAEDGNEFRRARLFVSGTLYGNVEFKVQYDFAGGDADFKDVYVGLIDSPVGGIRVGHFALNWYLNPATRVMLNYIRSDVDGEGDADFMLLRFQVDF